MFRWDYRTGKKSEATKCSHWKSHFACSAEAVVQSLWGSEAERDSSLERTRAFHSQSGGRSSLGDHGHSIRADLLRSHLCKYHNAMVVCLEVREGEAHNEALDFQAPQNILLVGCSCSCSKGMYHFADSRTPYRRDSAFKGPVVVACRRNVKLCAFVPQVAGALRG